MRSCQLCPSKGSRLTRLGTQNPFERNAHLEKDFDSKVISYEKYADVEDLNDHNPSFFKVMEAQGWEVAMMSTPESKVALPQIREFYLTMVKVKSRYYKDRQYFHLRLKYIAEVLGFADDVT